MTTPPVPDTAPIRRALLADLAAELERRAAATDHPLRVAVDGVTAAGKSTFAVQLTAAVGARGCHAVHLSTDDYHHVSAHRRRDPDRARGYYRDAYDLAAFRRLVLDPLGPGGSLRYRARLHDLDTDQILDEPDQLAEPDSVLVVDGSFLQGEALAGAWDAVVFLDVPYATATERAVPRDNTLFGSPEATRTAYAERYHAACRLYLAEVMPRERATFVVDNTDLAAPVLVYRSRS